jgi:hypothetical protein
MEAALRAGELDLIGIGRPMIADPLTPARLLSGEIDRTLTPEDGIGLFHLLGWYNMQLERLGDGLDPDLSLEGAEATAAFKLVEARYMAALLERRTRLAA